MIVHPKTAHGDGAFVFAHLRGFSCSVCAPLTVTQEQVEQYAAREIPLEGGWRWQAVDKSTIGLGDPTPNPCNIEPDRIHWFLLSDK